MKGCKDCRQIERQVGWSVSSFFYYYVFGKKSPLECLGMAWELPANAKNSAT